MSDQNNNDNWSNRNWQDASKFGGARNSNFGFGGGNGGFFGNNRNNDQNNNSNEGTSLFGNNGSGKIGGGWMQGRNSMLVIIVVLVIVIIYTFYTQISMNASITKSTIQRVKIESSFDSRTDVCFTDESGAVEDERSFRNAADQFHQATGVIPYIYFAESDNQTSPEELDKKAADFYKANFSDEDHFLVIFDGLQGTYYMGSAIGENAKTVIDEEALNIFKDYLTKFYLERQTNNQTYMANTLIYSSERMMTTAPYSKNTIIFGVIVIAALIVVVIIMIRRKNSPPKDQGQIEKM